MFNSAIRLPRDPMSPSHPPSNRHPFVHQKSRSERHLDHQAGWSPGGSPFLNPLRHSIARRQCRSLRGADKMKTPGSPIYPLLARRRRPLSRQHPAQNRLHRSPKPLNHSRLSHRCSQKRTTSHQQQTPAALSPPTPNNHQARPRERAALAVPENHQSFRPSPR